MNLNYSYTLSDNVASGFFELSELSGSQSSTIIPHAFNRPAKEITNSSVGKNALLALNIALFSEHQNTSTSKRPIPEVVEMALSYIFLNLGDEEFEYGYDSSLKIGLEKFINRYGVDGIQAIRNELILKSTKIEILIETLHVLGGSTQVETHDERLNLLISFLSSSSAKIRSAAVMGLSYLDDIRAIPVLEDALQIEKQITVKSWINRVLNQLYKTKNN